MVNPLRRSRSLERLLDDAYPLCREDLIWACAALQQKAAEGHSGFLELPQPRLLQNYRALAELASLLLVPGAGSAVSESEWRALLREAGHGLLTEGRS